jgi:hypothetical protein
MSAIPKGLLGASPFAIAIAAGLRLSLAQSATLKAIAGEPLTRDELRAFRALTRTTFAKPRAEGYRECFINAGRRGGKTSHVAAPVAVAALLSDPARLTSILAPGERARVLLVAPTLPHVGQIQDTIAGLLDRLGVKYGRREREIDLAPAGLRTVAVATVADHVAVRSGTAICAVVDEAALLPTDEGADGFDAEVFASLRPSLATTGGKLVAISTPWAMRGVHYETCTSRRGKTSGDVLVCDGPTWEWNPTINEAQTHELESDPRRWAREYAARAGEHESAFVDRRDVLACVDQGVEERPATDGTDYVAALDVAFRRDRTALVIAHRELRNRDGTLPLDLVVVDCIRTWTPRPGERLDFDALIGEVANVLRRYGSPKVYRDNFAGDAVDGALRQRGIQSEELPMSSRKQIERFDDFGQRLRARSIRLLDHDLAVRELVDLRVKLHAAGRVEIAAPNRKGAHDDVADALALVVHAAKSIAPSGDGVFCVTKVTRDERGVSFENQWFRMIERPDGGRTRIPAAPPIGSLDWEQAVAERQARGAWAPGDPELPHPSARLNPPVRE